MALLSAECQSHSLLSLRYLDMAMGLCLQSQLWIQNYLQWQKNIYMANFPTFPLPQTPALAILPPPHPTAGSILHFFC